MSSKAEKNSAGTMGYVDVNNIAATASGGCGGSPGAVNSRRRKVRAQWGYVDVNNIAATASASGEEEERMAGEKLDRARPTGLALRRVDHRRLECLAARDGLSKSATVRLLIAAAWRDVSQEAKKGG